MFQFLAVNIMEGKVKVNNETIVNFCYCEISGSHGGEYEFQSLLGRPDDGGSTHLCNVCRHVFDYMAVHPRRL
jgi:hypothetical protein